MDCSSTSIEPFFSHVAYKKLIGGGFIEIVNPEISIALHKLGYTENEIKDIIDYILRRETVTENGYTYEKIADGKIEGCPHLKNEHLPIFDTANKCGTGERYISPMAHVKMMEALSPMISGAISKTVNLPSNATMKEVSDIFFESWERGIKGITIYKDGSKVCQPLNSTKEDNIVKHYEDMKYDDLVNECYTLHDKLNQPFTREIRKRVDGIRNGTTHQCEVDGVKIYITVNRRAETNQICEMYITTDRVGSTITGLLNSLSKSISIMLQSDIKPVVIANMLKGQQYEPNGFVNRHPYIKNCDSISDLISRVIEIEIGDYSRCQVKPTKTAKEQIYEDVGNAIKKAYGYADSTVSHETTTDKPTKGERIYGKVCPNCGSSRMRQNGTCHVCEECGSTTGCS